MAIRIQFAALHKSKELFLYAEISLLFLETHASHKRNLHNAGIKCINMKWKFLYRLVNLCRSRMYILQSCHLENNFRRILNNFSVLKWLKGQTETYYPPWKQNATLSVTLGNLSKTHLAIDNRTKVLRSLKNGHRVKEEKYFMHARVHDCKFN